MRTPSRGRPTAPAAAARQRLGVPEVGLVGPQAAGGDEGHDAGDDQDGEAARGGLDDDLEDEDQGVGVGLGHDGGPDAGQQLAHVLVRVGGVGHGVLQEPRPHAVVEDGRDVAGHGDAAELRHALEGALVEVALGRQRNGTHGRREVPEHAGSGADERLVDFDGVVVRVGGDAVQEAAADGEERRAYHEDEPVGAKVAE